MGGGATDGIASKSLPAAIVAIASAIAMVIALGLELGMLYDYRVKDFNAAADGTAFTQNGSQCIHFASKADVEYWYSTENYKVSVKLPESDDDCDKITDEAENDLESLVAASVHVLYLMKSGTFAADADPSENDVKLTYGSARAGAGLGSAFDVSAANAVLDSVALKVLKALPGTMPDTGTTCETIYGTPTQADCQAETTVVDQGEAAGLAAGKAAAADETAAGLLTTYAETQAAADAAVVTAALDAYNAKLDEMCPEFFTGYSGQPSGQATVTCVHTLGDSITGTIADGAVETAVAARVGNVVDDNDYTKYILHLQCRFVNGLTGVSPVTSATDLVPAPGALGRGGSLGIPLLKYSSATKQYNYLDSAIPLVPFLEGLNSSLTPVTRGQILYGERMGWSMFAAIPSIILIVYLGVDSIFAALCYLTRRLAYKRMKFRNPSMNASFDKDVMQALVTMQAMRWVRFSVATTGFLIVFVLRIVYDWVPWNFGKILPRAGVCPSQGNGWESEEGVAAAHLVVLILCLVVIVAHPIALACGSRLTGNELNDSDGKPYYVDGSVWRVTLWFFLAICAGVVLIGLESVNAVAWGVAWGNRVLQWTGDAANGLTTAAAVGLIEESITGAVLSSISLGIILASIYTRYLFQSRSWVNKVCSILWLAVVLAGLLPLLITFGTEFQLNPDEQTVSENCELFGANDSFEKFLCENRVFTYTIAILIMVAVLAFMWLCWLVNSFGDICSGFGSATPGPGDAGKQVPLKLDASIASDKIPLLSLRVKH